MHEVFSPEFLDLAVGAAEGGEPVRLGAAQRRALGWWPLPMYLRIEDRVSMAHGVEARLPFTDYRLVEHALRMPDRLKFAGGINKVALRRVAAGRVPASVTSRLRKLGFPVGDTDCRSRLRTLVEPHAHSSAFRERGIYDHAAVAACSRDPHAATTSTRCFTWRRPSCGCAAWRRPGAGLEVEEFRRAASRARAGRWPAVSGCSW